MDFIKLFEPITINQLTVKNRIVMPAMALFYTDNYSFTERLQNFYRERAKGGVGLMIIGPAAIDKVGSSPYISGIFDDSFIVPFKKFNQELRRNNDVKIGIQLMHQGRFASSKLTGIAPIAPSPIASPITREIPREMTKNDIEEVKEAYAKSASRALEAEFDYIELLAAGGYLIGEFLSPVTNHRSDEYGGSMENRMRFGLEVIKKIRNVIGNDFAMGIRVSGHDFIKGGNTEIESAIFCAKAISAGAESINVTGGWHETNIPQITGEVPAGAFLYLSRAIKEKVSVPVFASNRLGNPVVAEKALRAGLADMICWGRPLIADPELPDKVKARSMNNIVPCISCNQGCLDSIFNNSSVYCVLNPRAGREDIEIRNADIIKRIFVAGGGPAGMEFALTASQRGHNVSLYEQADKLGGQINLIGSIPGKKDYLNAAASLIKRINLSNVKLFLNTSLTAEIVEKEKPDVLIVATGAKPVRLNIEGVDRLNVVNAWDILSGDVAAIGKQVVIIGGGDVGCETALFIAELDILSNEAFAFLAYHYAEDIGRLREMIYRSGRTITIIEILDQLAGNVGPSTRWSLLKKLKLLGINLRTGTKTLKILDNSIIIENNNGNEFISADTVVIAAGSKPVNNLALEINLDDIEIITIGDAKMPRKISDAILEGFDNALKI